MDPELIKQKKKEHAEEKLKRLKALDKERENLHSWIVNIAKDYYKVCLIGKDPENTPKVRWETLILKEDEVVFRTDSYGDFRVPITLLTDPDELKQVKEQKEEAKAWRATYERSKAKDRLQTILKQHPDFLDELRMGTL